MNLTLRVLDEPFTICRLDPAGPVPPWAMAGAFWCILRTEDELSIVCEASQVPPHHRQEGPWRALKVAGPLDLGLVGILANLTASLAQAGIPVFAVSSFDTDYLLVRSQRLAAAAAALREAGHGVEASG